MDNEIKSWLYDMYSSVQEIESYFEEGNKKYEFYLQDTKTKRAVERNLEIIGEAMNRILDKEPNINLTNARKIVDTRNRIIHSYDSVSDDIIWSIIINHLPKLEKELNELMKK